LKAEFLYIAIKYNSYTSNWRISLNKKTIIFLIFILVLLPLFSGCLEDSKPMIEDHLSTDNLFPVAKIIAPGEVFFEETIEFDASASYDSDGKIVYYSWDFGDGETATGEKVKHSYRFENDFSIEYPLIYTISLLVTDNDGSVSGISHEIKVYPSKYEFYLDPGKLSIEKPALGQEKIKPSQGLTYELQYSVNVSPCHWDATVYLKKPWLTMINRVTLGFYDKDGNEVSKAETLFRILRLWNEKTVTLEGKIDKKIELRSVKITIYGFSLRNKINIFYGGEKASCICFDFAT